MFGLFRIVIDQRNGLEVENWRRAVIIVWKEHSAMNEFNSNPVPPETLPSELAAPRSLLTLLRRTIGLRCPICGQGKLFRGWFRMHERCENCGYLYQRGPGYWLGSIYFNYGLTALLVIAGYFAAYFSDAIPQDWLLWILTAFCLLFPLWFFRYARSIWIALDVYIDPPPPVKAPATANVAQRP
jgi:uncharacterized protein (DUF983 family)